MKKDRRNVSEDDSEEENQKELERLVAKSEKLQEKIDKKKGSTTRRVRSDIFGEGRTEGDYMQLQREWTRGESEK